MPIAQPVSHKAITAPLSPLDTMMRYIHNTSAGDADALERSGLRRRARRCVLQFLLAQALVFGLGFKPVCAAPESPGIRAQQGKAGAPSEGGTQPVLPVVPGHPMREIPGAQPSQSLSLPQVWHPTVAQPLPPAPPVLVAPVIPAGRIGCWKGRPDGYDSYTWLTRNPLIYRIGSPGEMVVCFRNNTAEVTHAKVYISPAKRALDIVLQLGLSYTTFDAHSIHTDIYSITPTKIHLRFQLTLKGDAHLLFLFPVHVLDEPVVEDVIATPIAPDTALVEAREVLYLQGEPVHSATWHAYFKRIPDERSQ
jgi:hypothetical protein